MAMEPIWENDFHSLSYGFRPERSVHHAIRTVRLQLTDTTDTRGRWVIEGDLSSYFDTVHHQLLMKCVRKRISCNGFLDLLNNAITQFSHLHPGVKLVLQVGGGDDVIDSIKNEESDIGLLLNAKHDPKVDVLYSCAFQELSLLVPSNSAWAMLEVCSPSQMSGIPLALLTESFSIRRAVNLYEARQQIRLKSIMECNSFEALKNFVEAGLGCALLPKVCVAKELQNHCFVAIPVEGMHTLDTSVDLVMRVACRAVQ